jgi:hypothetical protein
MALSISLQRTETEPFNGYNIFRMIALNCVKHMQLTGSRYINVDEAHLERFGRCRILNWFCSWGWASDLRCSDCRICAH